jgi:hypothetical protein
MVPGVPDARRSIGGGTEDQNWSRAKKEALIAGDFANLRQAAKKKDWAGYRSRKQQRD